MLHPVSGAALSSVSEVPPAPFPAAVPPRLSRWDYLAYAASFFGFIAVVALSRWLHPAPGGTGTHTQLHLPPCGVLLVFGKPCPSCGMTTAFAWLAHGEFWRAWKAQPAGVAAFLAGLAWWLYLPVGFLRRKGFGEILESRALLPTVVGLIVVILVVWGIRLAGWS